MAQAAKAATTKVRIAPHRAVVIDGRRWEAGDVVTLPTDDAQTLIADGYASRDTAPKTKAPKKAQKTRQAPRRALTPRAIEDGDEERGGA